MRGREPAQLTRDFGSAQRWRTEFSAMGYALGGGSGWVLMSWMPRDGRLINQYASEHSQAIAGGIPILALDMRLELRLAPCTDGGISGMVRSCVDIGFVEESNFDFGQHRYAEATMERIVLSCSSGATTRQPMIAGMLGTCASRAFQRFVLVVAALALSALVGTFEARAQLTITAFVDKSQGTNGAIIVDIYDPRFLPVLYPYLRYIVPQNSGYPEDVKFVGYKEGPGGYVTYTINGVFTVRSLEGNFKPVSPLSAPTSRASIRSVTSRSALASPASITPGAVGVSNAADAFAATCDGTFALVVGSSSAGTPVALVDLATLTQVATLSYPNRLARGAAIGDDGSTALVVLDNATITNASTIARLTIGANGTLSDSGDKLAFSATDYVVKVRVAPGSHTGVALVNPTAGGKARLVSFALPGFAPRGSVALAGDLGNAIAFDGTGRKIYARSGKRAIVPDVIEAFDFDPATGTLAQAASLTIGNVSGFTGVVFANPMDVTADGALIIAAEENASGELPAPRMTAFSATTGAILGTHNLAQFSKPQTVATVPACMLSTPVTGVDLNQHGLTGSWYEPATSGQGLAVQIIPDQSPGNGVAFVSWFTFDTVSGGPERQRWYTLQGPVVTGQPSAALTIYRNTGGNFNAPPATSAQAVGTATLSFATCSSGELSYSFSDGSGRSGTVPLTRLLPNVTCSVTTPHPTNADFAFSGSWYGGDATSGQGLIAEVAPNSGAFFLSWFTYMPNGAGAGAEGQRWYTAQGAFTPGLRTIPVQLYETTGGIFDTATPPGQATAQVGTGTMSFQSCSAATMSYTFTGGSSVGLSGTIALGRVGPVPPGCTQ